MRFCKMKKSVKERFLEYVSYPTMSDETCDACPSTEKQFALARALARELEALGLEAKVNEHCYVYGRLAANTEKKFPKIGLIAHMDTSGECADSPIRPREVKYDGSPVELSEDIWLSEAEFPILGRYCGKHIIVTDGKTLLGADDKAGIAEIVSALELLVSGNREHGEVLVGFTPDEEIGRGADLFDVEGFGADFAYTLDGGTLGEIEYENFNAALLKVDIRGRSIHPGAAKDKMINAALVACEFNSMLPSDEIPAKTEGYEGFFHMTDISGGCENACVRYIIRDHDRDKFESKKTLARTIGEKLCEKYGSGTVNVTLNDSYYNMKEKIAPHMEIIERAENALRREGVEPKCVPIRGGTDGARLSYMGLLCPNLPTGGENYHSRYEFACVEDMETMVRVIVNILCAG